MFQALYVRNIVTLTVAFEMTWVNLNPSWPDGHDELKLTQVISNATVKVTIFLTYNAFNRWKIKHIF